MLMVMVIRFQLGLIVTNLTAKTNCIIDNPKLEFYFFWVYSYVSKLSYGRPTNSNNLSLTFLKSQ